MSSKSINADIKNNTINKSCKHLKLKEALRVTISILQFENIMTTQTDNRQMPF